ncbi:MAG: M23 family metallopeptidase [Thermoanaerobaculia bacterium]
MKQHTIIFVPHARAKFRKWRLSTLQVASIVGGLAFLTVGGVVATISYFGATVDRDQLTELQSENAALREVNDGFETSIRELESTVGDYQERIRKLAIVAGLSELSPPEAGIGGGDPVHAEGDLTEDLLGIETELYQMGRGMDVLQRKLDEHRLLISTTPAISPLKGLLTSGFGYRADPFTGRRSFHHGIDIVAPRGQEIRATGDGLVTKAGRALGLGNAVYVSHGFGIVTRYGHMSQINVDSGQRIRRGEVIGYVGSTGRATGNHVHYEVHVDGRATNPLGYILDGTKKRPW